MLETMGIDPHPSAARPLLCESWPARCASLTRPARQYLNAPAATAWADYTRELPQDGDRSPWFGSPPPRIIRPMELSGASAPEQNQVELLCTATAYSAHQQRLASLIGMRYEDLPALWDAAAILEKDPTEIRAELQRDRAEIEKWIRDLRAILNDATVVADATDPLVVAIGREADLEHLGSGRIVTHRVIGLISAGLGSTPAVSPVGSALIGRAAGDVVAVDRPVGHAQHLRVLAVRPTAVPEATGSPAGCATQR